MLENEEIPQGKVFWRRLMIERKGTFEKTGEAGIWDYYWMRIFGAWKKCLRRIELEELSGMTDCSEKIVFNKI